MSPMTKIDKVSYSNLDKIILRFQKGVKCSECGTSQPPSSDIATVMKFGTNVTNDIIHKKVNNSN